MANTLETRRLLPSDDLDYAAAFAALSEVHAEMHREGVSMERLLRRGHARFALGNYLAAAFDAERVAREEPGWVEAHYLKGQACLAMAAVKLGFAFPGVGVYMPAEGLPSRSHLLDVAQRAFELVLGRNPDDRQAARGLATAREWDARTMGGARAS
ncbi:MAG: hypothetical protein ABR562_03290 [Thermoplasmatota archaeon]|nr:hypothetical protein [Halobacteriales archaeon]